jgi:putative membrane protein
MRLRNNRKIQLGNFKRKPCRGQQILSQIIKYINMEHLLWQILSSVLFSSLGLVILLAAYYVVEKLTPENTWKEIVENKNVALAIVFGAFIIGIAIIISGAIHG